MFALGLYLAITAIVLYFFSRALGRFLSQSSTVVSCLSLFRKPTPTALPPLLAVSAENEKRVDVTLPDMYKSFLVAEPEFNAHYLSAKKESEAWLNRVCEFKPELARKVNACDFAYFISIAAPHAQPDRLKTMCDWGNWVFPFDDMFDSGHLRDDLETSTDIIDSLMADMEGRSYTKDKWPVIVAHDDVFRRVKEGSPPSVARRFARAMELYASGVLHHVEDFTAKRIPSLEEMLQTRQLSVGVQPLYHLVEYAHQLQIPDHVFQDPTIQKLEALGADFVILSNDILSYRKEESEDCPFNMVAASRISGCTPQQAFDAVAALLNARYAEWDVAMANLPSWGPKTDDQVRQYIEGIQNVVQANLSWSFVSRRYLGAQAPEIRKTRQIQVQAQPAYLSVMKA